MENDLRKTCPTWNLYVFTRAVLTRIIATQTSNSSDWLMFSKSHARFVKRSVPHGPNIMLCPQRIGQSLSSDSDHFNEENQVRWVVLTALT